MSDNRNYSVITNFGCHWQCPYCIVRNTGIQIAETRMGATYDTVMDLADSGKMKFLSFSGGGDPLWGLDIRRAYWYASITRSLYEYDIETEMHTSMPSMVKRMYNLAPAVEFSRIVYHLRNVNMIRNLDSIDGEMIRVVFVVTPDFTKDKIDAIVKAVKDNPSVDELSFRQMVKPDYSIDHTCEDYLHEGIVRRDCVAEDGAAACERDPDTGFDRLETDSQLCAVLQRHVIPAPSGKRNPVGHGQS
jgi:hypothetical protein